MDLIGFLIDFIGVLIARKIDFIGEPVPLSPRVR